MEYRTHIQIALVGGSPTPVYQGIVHMHPDKVYLICSTQSEKMAQNIKSQLPSYDEDAIEILSPLTDSDISEMYDTIENLESNIPKDVDLTLNLSGGMKLWTLVFQEVFNVRRKDCKTFFIDQNCNLFDLQQRTQFEKVAFDVDVHFKLFGHHLDEYTQLTEYTKDDFDVLNVVQNLGFNDKTHYYFFKITELFYDGYKEDFGNLKLNRNYEVSFKLNSLSWCADTHTFKCRLGYKEYNFCSPHVENIVLNTGWFELYVARLISTKYGAENIRMNCIFRNVKNLPKNEIDIIANTGSKLIFVECKTQIFNTTDVDKFRAAVRNYGGGGSKPLFITYQEMKAEGLEKCNDHSIKTFYINNPDYSNKRELLEAMNKVLDDLNNKGNI